MRVALVLALALILTAGCNGPSGPAPPPQASATQTSAIPPPEYALAVVVTQETPSGEPMRTQVQGIPLLADGKLGETMSRGTDAQGAARFRFDAPTTLLVRVLGPDGWTTEGARVHVGTTVAAEGLTVSDGDVFIPLFRSRLDFTEQAALSTALAQPQADLGVEPAVSLRPLAFPEGLQAAYLARLSDAHVSASWTDTEEGRIVNASVGLAWGEQVWVEGAAAPPTQIGARFAEWDGDLPAAGRPGDLGAATLNTALLTRTGIVGDVLVDLETTLRFGGYVPAEMPPEICHLLC